MWYKCLTAVFALLLIATAPEIVFASETQTETQTFIIDEKLLAVDADTAAEFGYSLVLSNDAEVLVVAAPLHDVGENEDQGQVYVYRRLEDEDGWTEVQRLVASDGAAGDRFGFALDIGDAPHYTIIVGAPFDDTTPSTSLGAAYLFTFDGTSWSEQAKLVATDPNEFSHDQRGTSVAISRDGKRAFVGAPGVGGSGGSHPGAVYVFAQSSGTGGAGETWTQTQKIEGPSDAAAALGGAMALARDDQTLFVKGVYAPAGPIISHGIVRVYQQVGAVWTEVDTLIPSDSQASDGFGDAMAVTADATTVVIGAPENEEGKVFAFAEEGGSWTEQAALTRPPGSLYGDFGAAVALDATGTQLAIGAWLNGSGGIHRYEQIESEWAFVQLLITPDTRQEHLGFSLAMSSDASEIIGGARSAHPDPATYDPLGAVYVYKPGYLSFLPGITH